MAIVLRLPVTWPKSNGCRWQPPIHSAVPVGLGAAWASSSSRIPLLRRQLRGRTPSNAQKGRSTAALWPALFTHGGKHGACATLIADSTHLSAAARHCLPTTRAESRSRLPPPPCPAAKPSTSLSSRSWASTRRAAPAPSHASADAVPSRPWSGAAEVVAVRSAVAWRLAASCRHMVPRVAKGTALWMPWWGGVRVKRAAR